MGCMLSCFEEKNELNNSILTTHPECFLCGLTFSSMNGYNKHIIHCKKKHLLKPYNFNHFH